eukprot:6185833-Pyramimonas_sp.AAC.1
MASLFQGAAASENGDGGGALALSAEAELAPAVVLHTTPKGDQYTSLFSSVGKTMMERIAWRAASLGMAATSELM